MWGGNCFQGVSHAPVPREGRDRDGFMGGVSPLSTSYGPGERCKLPQLSQGGAPAKIEFVVFYLKNGHLVTTEKLKIEYISAVIAFNRLLYELLHIKVSL